MTQFNFSARLSSGLAVCLLGSWAPLAMAETPSSAASLSAPAPMEVERDAATGSAPERLELRGYGGVSTDYTRVMGRDGVLAGFESGVVFNRTLSLGFAMNWFSNPAQTTDLGETVRDLEFGYGGLVVRQELHFDSPFYVGIGALVGPGALVATPERELWGDREQLDAADPIDERHIDLFTVAQANVGVYTNLTRWARVGVTVGYRRAFGVDKFNSDNSDLSGLVSGVRLQFGAF